MLLTLTNGATAIACLCLVSSVVILRILRRGLTNPLNKVPGPWYARWTNLPLKLAVVGGRRIHYVHALHKKYGPYVRISPNEIAVNDPKGFKQIHGIGSGFTKAEWYLHLVDVDRPGVFAMTDQRAHAARRKMFARPFSKTHLREHWEGTVREKVDLALSRMQDELRTAGIVDVLKWWTLMAKDVCSTLMFGDCFHTLESGEVNEYIRTLTRTLLGQGIGAELPLVRTIGKMLPLQAAKELFRNNDYLMNHGMAAVNNMKSQQGGKNIFTNIMVEAEKGEKLQDLDVQVEATGLLVADLEAEVDKLPRGYQEADLEPLPLLNGVIEETLRLYGAAPGMLPRAVPPAGADIGGYFVPPGTVATTQSYSLHRDPNISPEPESFLPERWYDETSQYRLTDTAKAVLSPFGAGSRTCLGIHLAYMELRLAAAGFFREISKGVVLSSSCTAECMEQENYFLIAPAGHRCEVVLTG
ncbi:cytochrome P450 monooxygenase-like protein [Hortaea werneckii]|nr:cytochrome P450 monooxygenase-like protein [Hortaea werneckii]KAI6874420.1 cytochrome P450 monooxygenase-like protein [Hortaea werneckii]KAI7268835.1 cytochrome P450 monooxygenase-like protein [Hortaea werneckii]KAI7348857.1 cytochrome P450 monooxygenase-like protein [Hortaea werneckii]KAI7570857.1 cytochrome P450 monooxygenase-like protein [Hortaea werneckii]